MKMCDKDIQKLYESFEDMGLLSNLLRGIYGHGFEKPSVIQKEAIVPMISGKDIIAQAQSGTGKTATFTIGTLNQLNYDLLNPQAIFLSPTKELCQQTAEVVRSIGGRLGVEVMLAVGGSSIDEDLRRLKKGVHVIVATTGRLLDLFRRKSIDTSNIKVLVLDEADELLYGFQDDVRTIIGEIPSSCQIGLFSATVPQEMLDLTNKFMRDPIKILVNPEDLTLEGIEEYYVDVEENENKLPTLMDLYSSISISQCVIFCNSKEKVDWIRVKLEENGFTTSCIHSGLSTKDRFNVLREFRSGKSKVLISTDLIARGIDIQQVYVVINWDLPKNINVYLHRIGRSGRFGRKGIAINFLTRRAMNKMKEISSYYGTSIQPLPASIVEKSY